eukprot:254904_1
MRMRRLLSSRHILPVTAVSFAFGLLKPIKPLQSKVPPLYQSNDIENCVYNNSNVGTGQFGLHDIGGKNEYIDSDMHYDECKEQSLTYWERKIDALKVLLQSKKYWTIPESRAMIEGLPKQSYLNIAYYEKWMYSTLMLCLKKGLFSEKEVLNAYKNHPQIKELAKTGKPTIKFKKGDIVRVRNVCDSNIRYENWRLYLGLIGSTHVRSPGYIVDQIGEILSNEGLFENDELKSLGINDTKVVIYRVRFKQRDLFPNKQFKNIEDTIDLEILSHWLEPVELMDPIIMVEHGNDEHEHKDRNIVEQNAIDKEPTLCPYEVISEVVIDILKGKDIITMNELHKFMENVDRAKK